MPAEERDRGRSGEGREKVDELRGNEMKKGGGGRAESGKDVTECRKDRRKTKKKKKGLMNIVVVCWSHPSPDKTDTGLLMQHEPSPL